MSERDSDDIFGHFFGFKNVLYKWFQLSANPGDTQAGKRYIELCCKLIFDTKRKNERQSTPAKSFREVETGYRRLQKLVVKHILTEMDVGRWS